MNPIYEVKQIKQQAAFTVCVPGSKSVTNRALMLAALSKGRCQLEGVLFSDDSRAFLDCLQSLGYEVDIIESKQQVCIVGTGGVIPNRRAAINVRSAGTAARFLTVLLALAGGDYELNSSEQMKKRPMKPLIEALRGAGVTITCLEQEGHFPFEIHSHGLQMSAITIDTQVSSQFASAFMMAGMLVEGGLDVVLTGNRTEGAYIQITRRMLDQFGVAYRKEGSCYHLEGGCVHQLDKYTVEPDVSAACYFYAAAAITGRSFTVRGVFWNAMQGDLKFLHVLQQMGCLIEETKEGICVTGPRKLHGVTVDLGDFSDQTMTLAVTAVFADCETRILNVGHIRFQESDRMAAILTELQRMGIHCEELAEEQGIVIWPGKVHAARIQTYEDHRMAMAFSLPGLVCEGIVIDNPACCGKTFENYFDVLDQITV